MTDQSKITVEEGNRLIAEFMGLRTDSFPQGLSDSWYVDLENPESVYHNVSPHESKFHSSWDWIKPVIDKIFTYAIAFPDQVEPVRSMKIVVDIQPAWERVVTFIQWYNSQKSKQ